MPLSKAYHTLIDPQERAYYDEQLKAQKNRSYSILDSNNPHAKRARNLAVQAKWDRLVDEVLERDRLENRERQRAVFTTVSLFLSTFFLAMMRPQLWHVFSTMGRVMVLTLFVIGVWHLANRLREYMAHYTYKPKLIQGSIITQEALPEQPFTRFSAYTFLLVGYALSVGIGLIHRLAHAGLFQRCDVAVSASRHRGAVKHDSRSDFLSSDCRAHC